MPFEIHTHAQHGLLSSLTTVILVLLVFVYSRGCFVFEVLPRVRFPLGELRHLWLDCFHCGSLWARPWPHLIISCSPST